MDMMLLPASLPQLIHSLLASPLIIPIQRSLSSHLSRPASFLTVPGIETL